MIIQISLYLIIAASVMAFLRLFIGPRKEDRIVALDAGTTMTAVLLVLLAYIYKRSIFLDVGLLYAVLAFIATLVAVKFLKKEL